MTRIILYSDTGHGCKALGKLALCNNFQCFSILKTVVMEASVLIFGFSEISEPLQRFRDQMQEVELRYYASDILEKNGYNNLGEFEKVLDRVQTILITAHVPVENHIRITFRGEFSQIYRDYKLSSLAYHLVRMNGSPQNQQVALYQIETYTVLNQSLN